MEYADEIKSGKIFIYPTDTIYGLGCDATNLKSVEKIKSMKTRDRDKPLSVIAPSFEWISENFIVDVDLKQYLPGRYTLLLKKKCLDFLKHISSNDRVGIRIPDCKFTTQVFNSGIPFVTTSVNLSGEPFAKSISEIAPQILEEVDIIIDEGILNGVPSTLVIDGMEVKR